MTQTQNLQQKKSVSGGSFGVENLVVIKNSFFLPFPKPLLTVFLMFLKCAA